MTTPVSSLFFSATAQAFTGQVNWGTDTLKMALLTPAAAPSLAWVRYSQVTREVAAGNGYATGGLALSSASVTVTAANSWGTMWAADTAYAAGSIVKPASPNGFLYRCVIAGTNGSRPVVLSSGPTIRGQTVTDGGVTWTCLGESLTQWFSAAAVWPAATITAKYGVIYDHGGRGPLVMLVDFGGAISSTAGNFRVAPGPYGWLMAAG